MNGTVHLHLPTQSAGAGSTVIDHAVAYARRFDAQLEASIATFDPPPVTHWAGEHFATSVLEVDTLARTRAAELAGLVRLTCKAASIVPTYNEYLVTTYGIDRHAALRARVHDLTFIGLSDGDGDTRRFIESLAFESGRPVMVVPSNRQDPPSFDRIVVAWDHSEAAARALAFALPVLKRAAHVDVVTVVSTKPAVVRDPSAQAVAYLKAHGVHAEARNVPAAGRRVGAALVAEAVNREAGLLVMGAYNTPRAHELLFGGVTKSLLDRPLLPLFIAN